MPRKCSEESLSRRRRLPVLAAALLVLAGACTETVVNPVDVALVQVSPDPAAVRVGASVRLSAEVRDSAGRPLRRRVAWASDDPTVAAVDSTGTVHGMAAGEATIRATVGGESGTSRITVQTGPIIGLEQPTVTLAAQQGQSAPAGAAVGVTNAGDGALTGLTVAVEYAAGQPTGWLAATLAATAAPTTLTLAATPGTLTAGEYTATVRLGAPGASAGASLAVTFALAPPAPAPPAAPTGLAATAVSATEVALSWTDASSDEREFRIERRTSASDAWAQVGLTAPGATSHTDAAAPPATSLAYRVTACNGAGCSAYSNEATVTTPARPKLALDRSSLSFGATAGEGDPAPQTLAVSNAGGPGLTGLAVSVGYASGEAAGWLDAALAATTAPTTIQVQPHSSSLAAGSYHATLTVSAPGADASPQTVAVRLDVVEPAPPPPPPPAPVIALQPASVSFSATAGGAAPAPVAVAVSNSGGGTLSGLAASVVYGAGEPTGWLAAALSATTAPATLTLTASLGSLAAGTYHATVSVAAPGASNTPQQVAVTLTVAAAPPPPPPPPPTATTAAATGVSETGATLNGSATPNGAPTRAWFEWGTSATSLSSSTAPVDIGSDAAAHPLSAALSSLAAATTYYFRAVAENVNGRATGAVLSFATPAPPPPPPSPSITLGATSASFSAVALGSDPQAQQIAVMNGGGGSLTGLSVSIAYGGGATGWLSANLGSSTAPSTLTIQAHTGLLLPGTYTATVSVASSVASNSPQTVAVTFEVSLFPPAAPDNLDADAQNKTTVKVSWRDRSSNETRFELERKREEGEYARVATLGPGVQDYTDGSLNKDTRYTYRVRACNDAGCSAYSNTDSVHTPD